MPTTPSSLSLANIPSGSFIVSADHRNNYTAIQTGVNALIALLAGGNAGQVLTSSGGTSLGWVALPSATSYRKSTAKVVNTTTTATDLLNGEVTIGAGAMGATGFLRLTASGDWLQNSGGTAAPPRMQVVFGGVTMIDTGATASAVNTSATRAGWRLVVEIQNTATNAQNVSLMFLAALGAVGGGANNAFVTGEGFYQSVSFGGTNTGQVQAIGTNTGLAVDTTGAKALVLNVINGSANAAYETKLFGALVEVL